MKIRFIFRCVLIGNFFAALISMTDFALSQVQVEGEIQSAWIRGAKSPPIVTTSPDSTPRSDAGVIGTPGTSTLYGGDRIDTDSRTGFRIGINYSPKIEDQLGFFLSGQYIGDAEDDRIFSSDQTGLPILSRPFFNSNSLSQDAQLVSYPGVLNGQVRINTESEFYNGEGGISFSWQRSSSRHIDLLFGYRYFSFEDSFDVREDLVSTDLGGVIPLGTQFVVNDQLQTENQFHGGKTGIAFRLKKNNWWLSSESSVSLGNLDRRSRIRGLTTVEIPSLPADLYDGGLLALPSNSGLNKSSTLAAIPEFRLKASREITQLLSLEFGYSFTLLPDIWRAAESIDYTVNETQIGGGVLTGDSRPDFSMSSSDVWIQSFSVGVTFKR